MWDPVAFIKGFFNDKLMPLCDPKVPKALSAIFTQGLCSNLNWWRMGGPLNCQVHQVRRAQNGAVCDAPRQVSPPYSLRCSSCIYPHIQLPTYSKTQTGVFFSYLDYFETLKWAYTNPYMPAKKVAILNMGNNKGFGGGWDIGYGGLESDIFMRTNISTSLGTFSNYQRPGPFECVYTKGVTLLRAGINEGYKFLDDGERMMFEVVTAYAYDNSKHCVPQKVDNDPTVYQVAAALNFDDEKKYVYLVTYNKISNVLTACLNNEVDTVILGALGCGYFQNPPDAVAAAFCCAIGNFTGNFDNIYISLIDEKVKEAFKQVALRYFPSLCYLEKNKEGKYCLTQLNKQDPSKNTSYQYN